jgi:hypothetical protein
MLYLLARAQDRDYTSINSGKSTIMSSLVKISLLSLGVQKTSTAFTQQPSSTKQSLAILANTSFVPAIEKPAPSNLQTTS